ncbi:hypothetical protein [Bacillus sp. JJ1764]|uniref:hypothetical protein n=1 Tax=Bacillus sp. JJ1764 TaxID=3122964 RepID=UPI002FFD7FE9
MKTRGNIAKTGGISLEIRGNIVKTGGNIKKSRGIPHPLIQRTNFLPNVLYFPIERS